MAKSRKNYITVIIICLFCIGAVASIALQSKGKEKQSAAISPTDILADTISKIAAEYPGEIGVALIINSKDTVTVNNKSVYPMMSVFKMHQALAICHDFDLKGISLDTVMVIERDELDPRTWSPMMKEHTEAEITLPVAELLRYTLIQSDNNASNVMFKKLVSAAATDEYVATVIPRSSFQIAYTEEEMSADHDRAYSNYTSPLGAAILIDRLFTDSLVSNEKQCFIKDALASCVTGKDRITAPLQDKEGIRIAHKTGSGYINDNGELVAHNDVAYIYAGDDLYYTLAVFVKDFKGNEAEASSAISRISEAVYSLLVG
ncbi:MAG: class A beta-lactamase [Muribaculaceae bacterium]|nr:class A beta-lactamase [Muribaculaceae bacterium]